MEEITDFVLNTNVTTIGLLSTTAIVKDHLIKLNPKFGEIPEHEFDDVRDRVKLCKELKDSLLVIDEWLNEIADRYFDGIRKFEITAKEDENNE